MGQTERTGQHSPWLDVFYHKRLTMHKFNRVAGYRCRDAERLRFFPSFTSQRPPRVAGASDLRPLAPRTAQEMSQCISRDSFVGPRLPGQTKVTSLLPYAYAGRPGFSRIEVKNHPHTLMRTKLFTRQWRTAITFSVPLSVLIFFLLAVNSISAQTCAWSVVASPNSTLPSNFLSDVSVVSANDVWAVGGSSRGTRIGNPLVEHWNGSSWAIVPAAQPPDSVASLSGVAALSANDVWAVGNSKVGNATSKTLTEHWDGATWTVIPSPSIERIGAYLADNQLVDVVAIAPNDVWAVGTATTIVSGEALTLHWDGAQWTIVRNPGMSPRFYDANLLGITAIDASNIWAVGQITTSVEQKFIANWNGTKWASVSSPPFPTNVEFLEGVSAISASDVWAVGTYTIPNPEGSPYLNATVHWDGTRWNIVTAPQVDDFLNILADVAAITASDVWAVGFNGTASGYEAPEVLHWDGSTWNVVPVPGGSQSTVLLGVAAVSSTDVWAVGETASGKKTLIEHFTCN